MLIDRRNVLNICYVVIVVEEILRRSNFCNFDGFLSLCYFTLGLVCFILFFKLLLDIYQNKIGPRNLIVMLAGFMYIVFLLFRGQTDAFMLLWLFVSASHDADFVKLVKLLAVASAFTCFFVWFCSFVKVIDTTTRFRVQDGEVLYARNGMGFQEAYHASYFMLFSSISWIYYRREKVSWYELLSILVISVLMYQQSDTRSPFYLSMILLLAAAPMKISPTFREYHKVYKWVGVLTTIICAAIIIFQGSCLSPKGYGLLNILNKQLSNRLQLNFNAVHKYRFSFWGKAIDWYVGEKAANPYRFYNWVDSVYLYSLLSYGIPFMAAFFAIIVRISINVEKRRDTYMVLALFIIAVLGLWDNYCFRIECNPFYLFLTYEAALKTSVQVPTVENKSFLTCGFEEDVLWKK